jgi:squalene synthase HpnC
VSVDHYENFPVASFLCPPALRAPIAAIYGFARTADDLADEGDALPDQRLADLAAFRADLESIYAGSESSSRWRSVFEPLQSAIAAHKLPAGLLNDLLTAFEQDVVKKDYADRIELLDYCRRSANPVGRLLLHLYGIGDARSLRQSDAICTALQLANFWQDLSIDTRNKRIYLPATDCSRRGVTRTDLLNQRDSKNVRALISDMVVWTRNLMSEGAPLVHTIPGRAGWELRLVVQGGSRILDKIEAANFATLDMRPTLRWHDAASMLWRAFRMRAISAQIASESA